MKKVFISQLMNGLTDEEIMKDKEMIINKIKAKIGDDFEIIDSFIRTEPEDLKNRPVWYLSKSITFLSQADLAVFGPGWEKGRGTVIENKIAKDYGMETIEF